ncbi:MAG: response regulator [Gammaproteobacteria bacterium]
MDAHTYCPVLSVIVVDDHHLLRRGITQLISEIPGLRLIGEAGSGEEAIRLARELQPDLVLMDLRMPGIGGLEAARRIHIALPRTRIIGVTAWEDEPMQRLFRNGFSACVGKSVTREELEQTIRRVCSGASDIAVSEPEPQSRENPFHGLTSREMQVCHLQLAGMRAQDIASRLFITSKTVHTFRYRIFEKLGVASEVELVRLATAHGLIGVDSPGA